MALYELVMPKLGESILEATIISWLKNEGDQISEDETLVEIATDKVDTEVPSPVSGKVKKLLFAIDAVVPIGATIALIDIDGDQGAIPAPVSEPASEPAVPHLQHNLSEQTPVIESATPGKAISEPAVEQVSLPITNTDSHSTSRSMPSQVFDIPGFKSTANYPSQLEGKWYSPLVRNIARLEGIQVEELSQIKGTGGGGRLTKEDLLNYTAKRNAARTNEQLQTPISVIPPTPIREEQIITAPKVTSHPAEQAAVRSVSSEEEIVEMGRMRKLIADHMVQSVKTSPHVTSVVEADVTRIVLWRNKVKNSYENKYGERLTFSPIFAEAVIKALKDFPMINASIDGDQIVIKKSINLGMATAMESGNLIVPVVTNAGDLNLNGLTKKLNDLTGRARLNKLKPDEIQNGTFTISNIGTFNNLIGTPIINQPQLAILAIGAIKKKPVIKDTDQGDIIAIRHMMFLSLSFDHRVIDGFLGGSFLNRIVHYIENFEPNREI